MTVIHEQHLALNDCIRTSWRWNSRLTLYLTFSAGLLKTRFIKRVACKCKRGLERWKVAVFAITH